MRVMFVIHEDGSKRKPVDVDLPLVPRNGDDVFFGEGETTGHVVGVTWGVPVTPGQEPTATVYVRV